MLIQELFEAQPAERPGIDAYPMNAWSSVEEKLMYGLSTPFFVYLSDSPIVEKFGNCVNFGASVNLQSIDH